MTDPKGIGGVSPTAVSNSLTSVLRGTLTRGQFFKTFFTIAPRSRAGLSWLRANGRRRMTTAHDFQFRSIDGEALPLSKFQGKALLVVNVASQCGLTPQYSGLEKLWRD